MKTQSKSKTPASRRKILLVFSLLIATWVISVVNNSAPVLRPPRVEASPPDYCIEVKPIFGPYQEASIESSGLYCIAIDFWQQRLSDFAGHTGPTPDRQLISIRANDTTLDIANHTLHSDGDSSGIVAVRVRLGDRPVPTNIAIRNGVLDLRGLGTAVEVVDHWSMSSIDEPIPSDFPGFIKSSITLENLLIKTDNVGVVLEGDGNIIRNCVIESGGDGAIMMAGPNGQIINNKIVLTEPFVPTWLTRRSYIDQLINLNEFRRIPRAAIALHRANGTIIRGNRIEVKGKSSTRHNIYLTDESVGILVEDNTIVGNDDPVTLRKGSTAVLKDNIFEQPPKPWWKF